MSRARRLLDLLQLLRSHRQPVTGHTLASALSVSLRTLYRDIATLQAQGAPIEGEAGIGYVLRPGFLLPPLMFSDDEIEALALGSRWVAGRTDPRLAGAAAQALAKIAAVLPPDLRATLENAGLLVGPGEPAAEGMADLTTIRQAIRHETKLDLAYRDAAGAVTHRIIWPIALGFFDKMRMIVAWCETRQDFRHFRTDRILTLTDLGCRYPRRRPVLLKAWRMAEGIADGVTPAARF